MDEQLNEKSEGQSQPQQPEPQPKPDIPAEPQLPPLPPTSQTPAGPEIIVNAGIEYASFFKRALAAIIDTVIMGSFIAATGVLFGDSNLVGSLSGLVAWIYPVIMVMKFGATLGKMSVGIRVQDVDTGENLDAAGAVLREVVGKFISMAVFMVGYLWMLWDDKKQCWHDKLGKSVVVKAKK